MLFVIELAGLQPEMLQKSSDAYGFAVDVWAVGVSLFEFLVGRAPFESRPNSPSNRTLYTNICARRLELPNTIPSEAQKLIEKVCVFVLQMKKVRARLVSDFTNRSKRAPQLDDYSKQSLAKRSKSARRERRI